MNETVGGQGQPANVLLAMMFLMKTNNQMAD
jgi:hypothetical protein